MNKFFKHFLILVLLCFSTAAFAKDWYVVMGSFKKYEGAEQHAIALKDNGLNIGIYKFENSDGSVLYRIILKEAFESVDQSRSRIAEIKNMPVIRNLGITGLWSIEANLPISRPRSATTRRTRTETRPVVTAPAVEESTAERIDLEKNIAAETTPVVAEPEITPADEETSPEVEETPVEEPVEEPSPAVEETPVEEPIEEPAPVVEETPVEESVEEPPVEEPVEEPAPVVEETPVEESVEEPAPEVEETPVEEPVEQPAPAVEETPVEEPVEEPAPEVEETPVEEPVEEPSPEVEEAPVEEPVEEPVPVVEEPPVEEPVEEPAPEVEETPVEESVEEPAPEVEEIPVEEPDEEPAPVVEEIPVEESVEEPTTVVEETPVEEAVEEPFEEPAPEVEETPVEEPVEEPAPEVEKTPVEEPVEEPAPEVEETPVEEPVEEPAPVVEETPVEEPAPFEDDSVTDEPEVVEEVQEEEPQQETLIVLDESYTPPEVQEEVNEELHTLTMEDMDPELKIQYFYIHDSDTAEEIEGANIEIDGIYNSLTDSEGKALLPQDLANGNHTVMVTKEGYVPSRSIFVIKKGELKSGKYFSIPKRVDYNRIKIILDWKERPADLDAHMMNSKSHVYFDVKQMGGMVLDKDDISQFGPETITILELDPEDTYHYFVFDYSDKNYDNSDLLSKSYATVTVYVNNDYYKTYHIKPDCVGMYWHVFDIVNGKIVDVEKVGTKMDGFVHPERWVPPSAE